MEEGGWHTYKGGIIGLAVQEIWSHVPHYVAIPQQECKLIRKKSRWVTQLYNQKLYRAYRPTLCMKRFNVQIWTSDDDCCKHMCWRTSKSRETSSCDTLKHIELCHWWYRHPSDQEVHEQDSYKKKQTVPQDLPGVRVFIWGMLQK